MRGRRQTQRRKEADSGLIRNVAEAGATTRTRMNWSYRMDFLGLLKKATQAQQRAIIGCTTDEITAGTKFPRGFYAAAEQIGRWLAAGGDDSEIIPVLVVVRGDGMSFREIAFKFRELRLGEKEGNLNNLYHTILRDVDEFRKQFPKFKNEQILDVLSEVFEHVRHTYEAG